MRILQYHADDAQLWAGIIQNVPPSRQDIHFLPEYAATCAPHAAGSAVDTCSVPRPCAAYWQSSLGVVLYPFLLRPVNVGGKQPIVGGRPACEIVGLYGMGGPLLVCEPNEEKALYADFDAHFQDWCKDEGIASEFLCPHIFVGCLERIQSNMAYSCVYTKDIIVIPLDGTQDDIWKRCNKGRKYEINLARRHCVTVEKVTPDALMHQELFAIYCETMRRKDAAARWYVSADYFQDCLEHLGPERVSFFVAKQDGVVHAWSVMLHHGETIYYHFAGSAPSGLKSGAPSLLLYHIAQWAQSMGFRRMYLGGGVTSATDDAVFRFKHSFSHGALPFFRAWRVLHTGVYEKLCHLKSIHERVTGYIPADMDFFPLYRR